MNINAASGGSYTNKASSNKGMSGFSGLDTDSMVEAMLSGTQSKIDKQQGVKQQLLWKQEIYRDIISQINALQSKYFSASSPTSLMSSAFFNSMTAVTKSSAFKVTASSSAPVGSTSVIVKQLASSSSVTSGTGVSGVLAGKIDQTAINGMIKNELDAERSVTFEMGGKTVKVDLTDLFVTKDSSGKATGFQGPVKAEDVAKKIEDAFLAEDLSVSASVENGAIKLTSADAKNLIHVSKDSTEEGLKALGLKAGEYGQSDYGNTKQTLSGKLDLGINMDFDLSLDGVQKTIKLDLTKVAGPDSTNPGLGANELNLDKLEAELESKVNKAFGNGNINVIRNGDNLEFKTGDGRKVMIGGEAGVLASLGFKNGQSNRIGLGGQLNELYFGEKLQGDSFQFTINGQKFKFDGNATITSVMNAINDSDAGVRVTYRALDDKFVLESTDSGSGHKIEMSQQEGNLLSAMFGSGVNFGGTGDYTLNSGGKVSSKKLYSTKIAPADSQNWDGIKGGVLAITVDGKAYNIKIDDKDGGYADKDEVIGAINAQLEKELGAGKVVVNSDGSISSSFGASVALGKLSITGGTAADAAKAGNLNAALGFIDGANNAATGDTTLDDVGLTGLVSQLTGAAHAGTETLSSLSGIVGFEDGKLTITGSGDMTAGVAPGGPEAGILEKLFGTDSIKLDVAQGTASDGKNGQNAMVTIDGVDTERSGNSFTINGLNFQLTGTTPMDEHGNYITETVDTTRSTDSIVEGIKGFIADYNKILDKLNGLVDSEATYKKYPPLTDAQRKEMSEKEIELWEEKSKEGLLRNDRDIENFLQSMRSAMYEKPTGSSLAIYDLGIETGEWEDKGKLVLSADGEAQLRKMIESDPSGVIKLFTDPEEGLAVKLNNIIDQTAKISSASPGTLVQMAGVKGKASATQNTIYDRLKSIDDKIEALKRTYEKEKNRYWRQFNEMEQALSNMNSQSSWLSQQLGM